MRRDTDTPEVDAMAAATHLLYCVPLLGRDGGAHRGSDPTDDAYCRSRARFLTDTLADVGWTVTRTGDSHA